jgi:hypothetical protein
MFRSRKKPAPPPDPDVVRWETTRQVIDGLLAEVGMRKADDEWFFSSPFRDPPDLRPVVDAATFLLAGLAYESEVDTKWAAVSDVLSPKEFADREAKRIGIERRPTQSLETGPECLLTTGFRVVEWDLVGMPVASAERLVGGTAPRLVLLSLKRKALASPYRVFREIERGLTGYSELTLECDSGAVTGSDQESCAAAWTFLGEEGVWASSGAVSAKPLDAYDFRIAADARGRPDCLIIDPDFLDETPCPHCGRGELRVRTTR